LFEKLGTIVGLHLASIEHEPSTVQSNPARIKQLVDVLAHELRNPLTIAEAYLEIGREDRDEEAFERVAAAHTDIEEIISTVMKMAEPGGIDEVVEVDVTSVATDVWQSIRSESAELTLGTQLSVSADPDLLRRLVLNLIKNAIDHAGPNVAVRVGALPDNHGFFVEDNGPGIPESERDTVFEWGYSSGEDHLGIGLGFVREIAEAHGWEITVSQSQDGGARFEIRTE